MTEQNVLQAGSLDNVHSFFYTRQNATVETIGESADPEIPHPTCKHFPFWSGGPYRHIVFCLCFYLYMPRWLNG